MQLKVTHHFYSASLFIITISGLFVWMLGRNAIHLGSSGWIFGLWGYLLAQAWFERSIKSMLIAGVVVFFYGGMIFGVLPGDPKVSFETHFFGALSGVVWAYSAARIPRLQRSLDRASAQKV